MNTSSVVVDTSLGQFSNYVIHVLPRDHSIKMASVAYLSIVKIIPVRDILGPLTVPTRQHSGTVIT